MHIVKVTYKVKVELQYSNIIMRGSDLQVILHKVEERYGEIKQKVTVEAYEGDNLIDRRIIFDSSRPRVA